MTGYEQVLEKIYAYEDRYRRPDLPALKLGPLYDLSPERGTPVQPCDLQWPATWANSDCAGIYAFFGDDLDLRYVGKASLLGRRLGAYCAYNPDKTCKFKHDWSPRYLITLGVPDDMVWEAAALEEYLIRSLDPPDNVIGRIPTGSLDD